MAARAYEPFAEAQYRDGIPVIISSLRRNSPQALDPAMKSCNLINNILAVREAQAKKAAEPLMLNERGDVAEGASANVFIVSGGALVTPPLSDGILPGVTRALVLEQARTLEIEAREQSIRVRHPAGGRRGLHHQHAQGSDADRHRGRPPIGSGKPGPVTLRLLEAYRRYARARLAGSGGRAARHASSRG